MKVSLSVLNVDYMNAYENLKDILDLVDYVHLDVMDGEFVPNISFGPDFVKSLKKDDKIAVLIGPEGGIDDSELTYLKDKGFVECALGPRILRTETASFYCLSSISYELELKK